MPRRTYNPRQGRSRRPVVRLDWDRLLTEITRTRPTTTAKDNR